MLIFQLLRSILLSSYQIADPWTSCPERCWTSLLSFTVKSIYMSADILRFLMIKRASLWSCLDLFSTLGPCEAGHCVKPCAKEIIHELKNPSISILLHRILHVWCSQLQPVFVEISFVFRYQGIWRGSGIAWTRFGTDLVHAKIRSEIRWRMWDWRRIQDVFHISFN